MICCFLTSLVPKLNIREQLHFLLLFNSISFSYWGDPKWKVNFHSEEADGAYGMVCSIARAMEEGVPIFNAEFLANLKEDELNNILRGNIQIPLFRERLNILREVGTTLVKKFDGDFMNVVEKSDKDAQKLLNLIIDNFSSFNDSSFYKGKEIYFYKRAQLLVADIAQTFQNEEFSIDKNVDTLTACADYKLPFVLRRLGIFSYSKNLANKIDNRVQIEKDSEEEVELRANTIWAIELIKEKVKRQYHHIDSIYINDYVWLLSQNKLEDDKPYHLTRTTSY